MKEAVFDSNGARIIGKVNWLGLRTLIAKEIGRFLNVYGQAIIAPIVTTLLFFMVFAFSLGAGKGSSGSISYLEFLAPGLIMISMAQNAFACTSVSLVVSKVQGNIVDILMTPLSSMELTIGYAAGGIVRGIILGVLSVLCLSPFVHIGIYSAFFIIYHALMGGMMLALMGIICGIWAEKFDQMASMQNFIVMPATFLSGTFYTVDRMPDILKTICYANPFFYMIDGFRYGFIGVSDGSLAVGIIYMIIVNALLLWAVHRLFSCGYKLKA